MIGATTLLAEALGQPDRSNPTQLASAAQGSSMATRFTYDVFLSYNSQDRPRVQRLAEQLRAANLRVWFDEWDIKPGDDIYLAIERGLEAARVQVLCLSPAALGSDWVTLERSTVLFRDPTNEGRRFVPLLLADCTLPDTLRRFKHLDFRHESRAAFDELLTACRAEAETAPTGQVAPPKNQSLFRWPLSKPEPEPPAVLERKLLGHKGRVTSVAVSPDGFWMASASTDRSVKIWDLETGQCQATLEGHSASVNSVGITPDGKRILSASLDFTVRVWDAVKFAHQMTLKLDGSALSVSPLPDNDGVLIGLESPKNYVELWSLSRGWQVSRKRIGDWTCCVAIDRQAKIETSGHGDGAIRLWDLQTSECVATLRGHSAAVNSIQVTPDGQIAVSGAEDKTVKVWDLQTGTCIGTLEGHRNQVVSVAVSPDGALIASTELNVRTIRIWDRKTGGCLEGLKLKGDNPSTVSVAFDPRGTRLVAATSDGEIVVFRLTAVHAATASEPTRRYVNAKVVLLGEGTVGKTSLAYRLIEDKYVVKDRTHGMSVWPLPLPLPSHVTADREALLWDLAGQEDYRLIHRLFLDETALALLLINPQKDDPFAEAGDWLKALDTAARTDVAQRQAVRLLIFSQVDVGGMKLSNAKIERFIKEHCFAHWLATSAKTGENCSDEANSGQPSKLKRLIADTLPWDKLPWTATPQLLAELKEALLKMRDTTDIRLLRFAELAQRLEQALPGEQFGESDVRTAVSLLANHGLVRPLKFGDLVLLQPELLNGYAGAIIRSARAHKDEMGCVLEADIYDPKFDFTGVERLKHRPDEELLLRAMVQTFLDHSLCIAEDGPQGRHLVFPSQYRRDKDIPRDPDIFVSYTCSGEWQTVWTTLVVRLWYSQEFQHRELWRNAAEFAFSELTLGLKIDNKQGEGTATISLYFDKEVKDEIKAIFIEYVHRHLAKHACEVTRDRRYLCPVCGKPVQNLDAVRRRKEAGKAFINCQECDDVKVPFLDFIEQRLESDPVARKILAMDQAATRKLDTQALEQILLGHMMAVCGEANQIFRSMKVAEYGVDGEVEFKNNDGIASGMKISVLLRSDDSYLKLRKIDGTEIFDVQHERHLESWVSQSVDVYLVIRQSDEVSGGSSIRWMNLTRYLKTRTDKRSRRVIFDGELLTMHAVWRLRDQFFPPRTGIRQK
jgi:WD40 repeat protein